MKRGNRKTRHLAAVATATIVLGGGLATGGPASAAQPASQAAFQSGVAAQAGCLDGARTYTKGEGRGMWPLGAYAVTGGVCNDINWRPNTNRYVKVCFVNGGCQRDWRLAKAKQWNVIASGVLGGTQYWVEFRSTAKSTGYFAD